MEAEELARLYGMEIEIVDGPFWGEYSGGKIWVDDDTTLVPYRVANYITNGGDFISKDRYPFNTTMAAHEIAHGLFSQNAQAGHEAMKNLEEIGVPKAFVFENLVDLGGLYLLEPDAIDNFELREILDKWLSMRKKRSKKTSFMKISNIIRNIRNQIKAVEMKDYLDGMEDSIYRDMAHDDLDFLGARISMDGLDKIEFRREINELIDKYFDDGLTLFQVFNWFKKNTKFRNENMVQDFINEVQIDELQRNRLSLNNKE